MIVGAGVRRAAADSRWAGWRWAARGRVVEAAALLAAASAAQKWVPMARWSGVLGSHGEVPPSWRGRSVGVLPQRADTVVEWDVARAIRRACMRLPWEPTCLAQAAAGQVMLRRRGRAGVVVVGLRPGASEGWDAHAWLMGAQGALTGGPAAAGFTATTVFEFPEGLHADRVELVTARGTATA